MDLTKTQVASRPETMGEMWSSMSKCAQKKGKQQWDIDKFQIQAARQNRKIHEITPVDAIILNARKELDIPVEPATPFVTRKRILAAKTQAQKVAVSEVGGGRPPALSEGRLSPTQKERNKYKCPIPKGVSLKQGEMIRMKITLQIEDFTHGIILIWYIHLCQ